MFNVNFSLKEPFFAFGHWNPEGIKLFTFIKYKDKNSLLQFGFIYSKYFSQ